MAQNAFSPLVLVLFACGISALFTTRFGLLIAVAPLSYFSAFSFLHVEARYVLPALGPLTYLGCYGAQNLAERWRSRITTSANIGRGTPEARPAFFDAFVPYKRAILDVLADSAVVIASYTAAYLLRYEGRLAPYNTALLERSLPILLACRLVSFRLFGLYRKVPGHLGISDVIETAKAIALSSSAFVVVLVGLYRFQDYSRAVLIIDAALTFGLVLGTRASLSFFQDHFARNRPGSAVKTLIIGAGSVGGALARELCNDPDRPCEIVAYVDDDPRKIGRRMNGVPVWGPIAKLPTFLDEKAIDEVVITTRNLNVESRRAITEACGTSHVTIRRATLEPVSSAD